MGTAAKLTHSFFSNFLGDSPLWYKRTVIAFLVINPILLYIAGPFITGWVLIGEFIFTLAAALKCYPLPPGGLLVIQAILLGMASPDAVYTEVSNNFPVLLLLMFMVAGIHFMKEGLQMIFTMLLTSVRSKIMISFLFCILGAFLSAFLDALTVVAVIIAVAYGFYGVYNSYLQSKRNLTDEDKAEQEQFRGFLRNLMMHGAVGTALGGAVTLVGEPQNLLIGKTMGWDFGTFFLKCAAVSIPVLITGLVTCLLLEATGIMGYGYKLPQNVRSILHMDITEKKKNIDSAMIARLAVQGAVGILLILALAMHVAEVGLVGLMVIILLTAFKGVNKEHHFGEAFADALPFTALLVVFFGVVAVIHEQHLFKPLIQYVLSIEGQKQLVAFFLANGVLSAISDNVFVATVYITEIKTAFEAGLFSREWYDKLAVAVNMGTNIPSVATPNGQAAFLFLLTSALAPLIRLSYLEMVKLAIPYTITMVSAGLLATIYWL